MEIVSYIHLTDRGGQAFRHRTYPFFIAGTSCKGGVVGGVACIYTCVRDIVYTVLYSMYRMVQACHNCIAYLAVSSCIRHYQVVYNYSITIKRILTIQTAQYYVCYLAQCIVMYRLYRMVKLVLVLYSQVVMYRLYSIVQSIFINS